MLLNSGNMDLDFSNWLVLVALLRYCTREPGELACKLAGVPRDDWTITVALSF